MGKHTTSPKKASVSSGSAYSSSYSNPVNFIQVACDYYMISHRPDAFGHMIPVLIPWRFSQIKRDFGENNPDIFKIPRFLGMGCYPCNDGNYKVSVNDYYNTYQPLPWMPKEGSWNNIRTMIRHIFGEQYELGVDYLQLLYINPVQKLPILLLVSNERSTGKTTFMNFVKEIFGGNMVFVTNETFRSSFNSDRAGKLIVACDETFLNKKEDSEKLKALSTAMKTHIEFKGKDRHEIDNYAKFIFASNNVSSPIYIDACETRYWVRQVPVLKESNPFFLSALKEEIPAFLYFLAHRQLHVPVAVSRMWFSFDDVNTPAQEYIKRACRPSEERELAELLLDIMDEFCQDVLCYTVKDLGDLLHFYGRRLPHYHLIISSQWNIEQATSKKAYDVFAPYIDVNNKHRYGRYYKFTRELLEGILPKSSSPTLAPAPEAAPATDSTLFHD